MSGLELLTLCRAGDKKAMETLYSMYSKRMMSIICKYISDQEAAKDILHDGFIVIFTQLYKVRKPDRLESWMGSIMRNLSLQYKEQSDRFSTLNEDIDIEDTVELTEILTREELETIINKLPEGYRTIFRLKVLENKSHKEIGRILGIAPNSSSSQLSHAKNMLRRLINEYMIKVGLGVLVAIVIPMFLLFRDTNHINTDRPISQKMKIEDVNGKLVGEKGNNTHLELIKTRRISTLSEAYDRSPDTVVVTAGLNHDTISGIVSDSVLCDSLRILEQDERLNENIKENHFYAQNVKRPSRKEWTLSIEYSCNNDMRKMVNTLGSVSSGEPDGEEIKHENIKHHMPFTVGLSFGKTINNRWSIESGIRYKFLKTDITTESKYNVKEEEQQIHYIGIPLKLKCKVYGNDRISIYGTGGLSIDIPIVGKTVVTEQSSITDQVTYDNVKIRLPLQWSIEGGIGFQYHIGSGIGVFAEPSVNYYIDSGSGVSTIYTDRPFEFSVPIGVRLTW